MKKIIEKVLALLARMVIKKYQPQVIGITGSVGKSSTKEAVYTVLQGRFNVRRSEKNYNNELGLPLTVIGAEPAGKSIGKWLKIILKAIRLIVWRDMTYPNVLILEYGADKPGDIGYLSSIVPCTIGVVTKVSPAHIAFFGSVEKIAKEKQKLVTSLGKDGVAILNFDDELVCKMAKRVKGTVLGFGYADDCDVKAYDLQDPVVSQDLPGLRFKVMYKGSTIPIIIPGMFAKHQTYAMVAAIAVGVALKMNVVEIAEQLRLYVPPKGRMNLIPGIKNTLLVDDTYNSSPDAAHAALEAIGALVTEENQRTVALLGDMLELGDIAEEEHYTLGFKAGSLGIDALVAVGKYRDVIAKGATEGGVARVNTFKDSREAVTAITELVEEHDVILIKGSQGTRMERVVKVLMAHPEQASDLLVRQSDAWLKK